MWELISLAPPETNQCGTQVSNYVLTTQGQDWLYMLVLSSGRSYMPAWAVCEFCPTIIMEPVYLSR